MAPEGWLLVSILVLGALLLLLTVATQLQPDSTLLRHVLASRKRPHGSDLAVVTASTSITHGTGVRKSTNQARKKTKNRTIDIKETSYREIRPLSNHLHTPCSK